MNRWKAHRSIFKNPLVQHHLQSCFHYQSISEKNRKNHCTGRDIQILGNPHHSQHCRCYSYLHLRAQLLRCNLTNHSVKHSDLHLQPTSPIPALTSCVYPALAPFYHALPGKDHIALSFALLLGKRAGTELEQFRRICGKPDGVVPEQVSCVHKAERCRCLRIYVQIWIVCLQAAYASSPRTLYRHETSWGN